MRSPCDDLFAAQLYVQDTVETSVSIRKKLTPNVARIFDPQLQKKRAIDAGLTHQCLYFEQTNRLKQVGLIQAA